MFQGFLGDMQIKRLVIDIELVFHLRLVVKHAELYEY